MLVLLNGAEEKHIDTGNYAKSRGLIVIEIIGSTSPFNAWQTIDLDRIEPFTLVLFENFKLYQLRWNGEEKNVLEFSEN